MKKTGFNKLYLYFLAVFVLFVSLPCSQAPRAPLLRQRVDKPTVAIKPPELVISAVGDIMMSSSIQAAVAKHGYNYDILFEKIAKDLAAADITIANLETQVDHAAKISGYPKFNAHPGLLTTLKKTGIDILSVANNHVMDRGVKGLVRTLGNIEAAGLAFIGAGRTKAEASEIRVLTVRGTKVAFLAYTYNANRRLPGRKAGAPGVNLLHANSEWDLAQACGRVREAKSFSDVVVLSLHWGDEYSTTPTAWQRHAAARLIDSGADIIFGHHPHVLQPIESLAAKDGRQGIVAYSLGNFISSQNAGITYERRDSKKALRGEGIVLSVFLSRRKGGMEIRRAEYLPTWTLRERTKTAIIPRPVSIAPEIKKLESIQIRSGEQERLLQFLTDRQKRITEKLIVNVQ